MDSRLLVCLLVVVISFVDGRSGRERRDDETADTPSNENKIIEFAEYVGGMEEKDLILLLDRSHGLSKRSKFSSIILVFDRVLLMA